jgi:hypothetical protein
MGANLIWHEAVAFPTLRKRLCCGVLDFDVAIAFVT